MTSVERDQIFKARLSKDEVAMLRELADKRGMTASDWLRQTIRENHAVTFDGRPPHKKTNR